MAEQATTPINGDEKTLKIAWVKWFNQANKRLAKWRWYRVVLVSLYKARILGRFLKENIFFDLKLLLFYLILLSALLFFMYPFKKYVAIPNYDTVVYIIENLSRATAVFIGIIISLIILSFQIFNANFGRYAFVGFFNNRYIKFLFTLYVVNILLSMYALTYFKNVAQVEGYGTALFLLSVTTSITLIVCILPVSVALMKKSQSRSNLQGIYEKINENWIYSFQFHQNNRLQNLEITEDDPLRMLTEIGKKFIRDEDSVSVELLAGGLYNYFITLIEKHKKENTSINSFAYYEYRDLVSELIQSTIKAGNRLLLYRLLRLRTEIELYVLKNSLKHSRWKTEFEYDSIGFELDHERYFHLAIMEDDKELAESIIESQAHYCEYLIKNVFPQTFLEYDNSKYEEYSKEKHMSYQLLSHSLRQFSDMIRRHKRIDAFRKLFNSFYLDGVIIDSKNSSSVKSYLQHLLKYSKIEMFNVFLDMEPREIGMLDYPMGSIYLQQEIENIGTKSLFNQMKEGMKIAYSKSYLNTMMINQLKAAGMGFISKFNNKPSYKALLKEVIAQFDYLRSIIPADGSNYQKSTYVKLQEFFGYVKQDFERSKIQDDELKEILERTFHAFDKIEDYKKHLASVGYISDDNL